MYPSPSNVLYYESHVTIEPVFDERLAQAKEIAARHNFRVAELLMKKRPEDTPERSQYDTFMTGRSDVLAGLAFDMSQLVGELREAKFVVWRAKIEAALYDERYEERNGG